MQSSAAGGVYKNSESLRMSVCVSAQPRVWPQPQPRPLVAGVPARREALPQGLPGGGWPPSVLRCGGESQGPIRCACGGYEPPHPSSPARPCPGHGRGTVTRPERNGPEKQRVVRSGVRGKKIRGKFRGSPGIWGGKLRGHFRKCGGGWGFAGFWGGLSHRRPLRGRPWDLCGPLRGHSDHRLRPMPRIECVVAMRLCFRRRAPFVLHFCFFFFGEGPCSKRCGAWPCPITFIGTYYTIGGA